MKNDAFVYGIENSEVAGAWFIVPCSVIGLSQEFSILVGIAWLCLVVTSAEAWVPMRSNNDLLNLWLATRYKQ